jgi:hypothetical protein
MASNFGEPPPSIWEEEQTAQVSDAELEKLETSILAIETIDDWNQVLAVEAQQKELMLVTLTAQWYKPVMSFLGKIHDLSMEYPSVLFAIIDLDESRPLVQHLQFLEQPGMRLYLKGERATEFSGISVFNNPPELETILRFELEKHGAQRVEVNTPDVTGIIQQAIQLAKPGASQTLKLRPQGSGASNGSDTTPSAPVAPAYRYFPNREYQLFPSTANITTVEAKLISFASTNPQCHLNPEQVQLVQGLVKVLSDEGHYSTSNFEDGQLEILAQMLETWPVDTAFPVLDLLRLALVHPIGRAYFLHSSLIPSLLQKAQDKDSNVPFAYQFMTFKAISNLFDSRITKQLIINLFESALSLCTHVASSTNKNLQLVSSTLLLNYVTFLLKEGITDDVYQPTPLLDVLEAILTQTASQSDDATFRLAIAIGTLHMASNTARQRSKQLLTLLIQHAEALKAATPTISEHTAVAVQDLSNLVS